MKICFFGEVYQAMIGNVIGGAELQMALLAQALSQAGHEVVIIDPNLGKIVGNVGNIKIFNCSNGGIRIVRFFTQRFPNYIRLCSSVNADVYYVRGRSYSLIIPLLVGKFFKNKIFIKAISSDIDVLPFISRLKRTFKYRKSFSDWLLRGILTESICSIICNHASLLLLQHKEQNVSSLNPKVRKYIFQNLFPLPLLQEKAIWNSRNSFLFVGTLSPKKGVVELKRVAEKLPDIQFQVIGAPEKNDHSDYLNLIRLKNVHYHGKQDREFILSRMKDSLGLINTSPAEGFPNTFLESWYCGCPVISLTVDPGNVISKMNLGLVCHTDINLMVENIKKLNESSVVFEPDELRDYVITNHSTVTAAEKFIAIIKNFTN